LASPPQLVINVLDAVCCLLDKKHGWKSMLSDPSDLLNSLKNFDSSTISAAKRKKLNKMLENENFNAEQVKRCSVAAASFAQWVIDVSRDST
jgi:hypothetical protein